MCRIFRIETSSDMVLFAEKSHARGFVQVRPLPEQDRGSNRTPDRPKKLAGATNGRVGLQPPCRYRLIEHSFASGSACSDEDLGFIFIVNPHQIAVYEPLNRDTTSTVVANLGCWATVVD